jgi:hypothetical protein
MNDAGLQRRGREDGRQRLAHALQPVGDRDQDVLAPARLQVRFKKAMIERALIGTHERRFTGFDDKILALYAVVAEVTAWQSRPLEPMYPVVFL